MACFTRRIVLLSLVIASIVTRLLAIPVPSADPCSPNDTPCVSSCEGLVSGDYQSCHGCHVYVSCAHDVIFDDRLCPGDLVWDDIEKRCEWESKTCLACPGPTTVSTTTAVPTTATTPTTPTVPTTTTPSTTTRFW